MKRLLIAAALSLLATACTQNSPSSGMMQGDMMKNCQAMMDKGMAQGEMMPCCQKMMQDGGMSNDMMKQCQGMRQGDAGTQPAVPAAADNEDHKQHHPAP